MTKLTNKTNICWDVCNFGPIWDQSGKSSTSKDEIGGFPLF